MKRKQTEAAARLDPPTFAFAPHAWPLGDKMVTMPLWQWTAALRELARAEQWPVARYTETWPTK